jgi:hypothetical protein
MNQDTINACYKAFENDCYNYVVFSESKIGEISFFEQRSTPNIDHLYTDYYATKGDRLKFHLFKFEKGQLIWIESYNFETKMVDIPIDINDDVFLMLAKQAHEKNITINERFVEILQEYVKKEHI